MKNVKIQIFDVLEPGRPYWDKKHAFMFDVDDDYNSAPARLCHPNVPDISRRHRLIHFDTPILKDEGLVIELSNMEVLYFGIMSEIQWRLIRAWKLSNWVEFPNESASQRQNEFKDLAVLTLL